MIWWRDRAVQACGLRYIFVALITRQGVWLVCASGGSILGKMMVLGGALPFGV